MEVLWNTAGDQGGVGEGNSTLWQPTGWFRSVRTLKVELEADYQRVHGLSKNLWIPPTTKAEGKISAKHQVKALGT